MWRYTGRILYWSYPLLEATPHRADSFAMIPSVFGTNFSVTTVKGRPSGVLAISKPCASSAIIPIYESLRPGTCEYDCLMTASVKVQQIFLRHRPSSPSVTTSQPAWSCIATPAYRRQPSFILDGWKQFAPLCVRIVLRI